MGKIEYTIKRIGDLINKGYNSFILYPFGDNGRLTKCILEEYYGINPRMLVDENLKNSWKGVKGVCDISEEILENSIVLLTSDKPGIHTDLVNTIKRHVADDKIIELYPESVEKQIKDSEIIEERKKKAFQKLEEEKLEDKGMCYKIKNGNSIFFLPYVYMDFIQQEILNTDNYFENSLLQFVFHEFKDGLIGNTISNKKNATVLDIGANIGNHTLYFINELHVEKVASFEPVYETFRILKKNILLNGVESKVDLFNVGLSDKSGQADIIGYSYGNIGGTSLREGDGPLKIAALDEFAFEDVSFIKIDVERMELKVLRGSLETIKKCRPFVLVESFHETFPEVKKFFEEIGYNYCSCGGSDHLFFP